MQEFSESVSYDKRLWREDIQGSLAYAAELQRIGILTEEEYNDIQRGFEQIKQEIEADKFEWKIELEDVHMNIEARLTEIIGDAGKKLHTGRSRNDQVATDFLLWCSNQANEIGNATLDLTRALVERSEECKDVIIPAYTHLQRAMPVRMAHHLLAYFEMIWNGSFHLELAANWWDEKIALGSSACTGNSFPVDMFDLAHALNGNEDTIRFGGVDNSMYGVSNRDFALDLVFGCAKLMTHLSRLCEDMILWSSSEFGFVQLGDAVTTGSSIMPQKRNPDACELVRGKTGRVVGHLMALFTTLKGLPMTYNRDLQEDKEGVFDAVDQTLASLRVMTLVFSKDNFNVNRKRIQEQLDTGAGYMEAMNVADWLVEQGVPFRDGHDITGRLVKYVEQKGMRFADLTSEDLASVDSRLKPELLEQLSLEALVERKTVQAGTALDRVEAQIEECKAMIERADNFGSDEEE